LLEALATAEHGVIDGAQAVRSASVGESRAARSARSRPA